MGRAFWPVVMILSTAGAARAQCGDLGLYGITFTVTAPGGMVTRNCTRHSDGQWTLGAVIEGSVSGNPTATVLGPSTAVFRRISIQNNTLLHCNLTVRGSASAESPIQAITEFVGKDSNSSGRVVLVLARTSLDVGAELSSPDTTSSVSADRIIDLFVGGDLYGRVETTGPSAFPGTIVNIDVGNAVIGSVVVQTSGSIDKVVAGGNVRSGANGVTTISAPGNIGELRAATIKANVNSGGTIHRVATTSSSALSNSFEGSITAARLRAIPGQTATPEINIAGDFNANMSIAEDIRVPVTVGRHFISGKSIVATQGLYDIASGSTADFTITGDCAGNITLGTPTLAAGSLNTRMVIGGSLTGTLTLSAPLAGQLFIGDSLSGTISLPAMGLTNQIIVNRNASSTPGTWTGNVSVNSVNLSPKPNYAQIGLGGGAVGLVPYRLYLKDCEPRPLDSTGLAYLVRDTFTSHVIDLRFYGRIALDPVIFGSPAVVEWEQTPGTWVDQTSLFTFTVNPFPSTLPLESPRTLRVLPLETATFPGGTYRIRRGTTGELYSWDVNVLTAVDTRPDVPDFTYMFHLSEDCDADAIPDDLEIEQDPTQDDCPGGTPNGILDCCEYCGCAGDFNQDNAFGVQDLYDFYTDWNSQVNSGPVVIASADVNGSGTVTVQDLYDYIEIWNAGCTLPDCD